MKFMKDSTTKYGETLIIGDLLRLEEDTDGRVSIRATGAGGTGILLDDLTDVIISSPTTDQFLRYNGTNWVNQLITAANVGAGIFKNGMLPSKDAAVQITGDDSSGGAQLNNPPNIALIAPEVGISADQNQSDAKLELISSRSTIAQLNAGTFTAVVNGDQLGEIRFGGDDGVNIRSQGARIIIRTSATWTNTSHPANIYLATVASGSVGNALDRWVIDSTGALIAINTPGIISADGTATIPSF